MVDLDSESRPRYTLYAMAVVATQHMGSRIDKKHLPQAPEKFVIQNTPLALRRHYTGPRRIKCVASLFGLMG